MHTGKLVFAQLMEHLSLTTFRRCVARYGGHHKIKRFTSLDQYLSMAFAQLTFRESLRDIEACLRAQSSELLSLGLSQHGSAQHRWPTPTQVATGGSTAISHSV
jgi:hypothetical protein